MSPLLKKLNFKSQKNIVILNPPDSFAAEMEAMSEFAAVSSELGANEDNQFVLAFATKQSEVDAWAVCFSEKTEGDAVLWIAYPKGSSKRYKCDFNRDNGWDLLGKLNFEPVRQVAIDDDWSALRFRRVDFIKTMTRSFAMTEAGKEKVSITLLKPEKQLIAEDIMTALQQNPAINTIFEALSPSHRKEYIRWVEEAKKPETRANRIQKMLEKIADPNA